MRVRMMMMMMAWVHGMRMMCGSHILDMRRSRCSRESSIGGHRMMPQDGCPR